MTVTLMSAAERETDIAAREEPVVDWLTDSVTRVINNEVALLAEDTEPGKADNGERPATIACSLHGAMRRADQG